MQRKSYLKFGEPGFKSTQFNQYSLNTYYVPDTASGAGDVYLNKATKIPAFRELMFYAL